VEFNGACPFVTCLKVGKHSHPVCPVCGAVRFGNLSCDECRRQSEPGGLRWKEDQEWLTEMKKWGTIRPEGGGCEV